MSILNLLPNKVTCKKSSKVSKLLRFVMRVVQLFWNFIGIKALPVKFQCHSIFHTNNFTALSLHENNNMPYQILKVPVTVSSPSVPLSVPRPCHLSPQPLSLPSPVINLGGHYLSPVLLSVSMAIIHLQGQPGPLFIPFTSNHYVYYAGALPN